MKKLFLLLIAGFSLAASAQWNPPPGNPLPPMPPIPSSVYPQVTNYGTHAGIWVRNNNQHFVACNGTLSMYMDGPDARVHTAQINFTVYPRGYMNQTFRPNSAGRIRRITHNIYCR